jgi:cellulose synthase/poly-beta-1,6-N-acetylglucosamine synthase-like glycosyltransferase
MLGWTTTLFVVGRRWARRAPPPQPDLVPAWTWVFLVAALNEEVTIADTVRRLRQVRAPDRLIVVIDDGSDDGTAAELERLAGPDLAVVHRSLPDARRGKAAALNDAYGRLGTLLGARDRSRVVVGVVDADGRIDADAPAHVVAHFAEDPAVGGVQLLVRIYNRRQLLTWMQDVEFGVYGFLYQAGRSPAGTAGMGGNGQFNRLSALDAVSASAGPWRDRLTEDQDLGLRLIAAGWRGRQELRASVHQQGLPDLRRLLRQRTRWSQGNLQALGLLTTVRGAPAPPLGRLELLLGLLMPVWQTIVGAALVLAVVRVLAGSTYLSEWRPVDLVVIYLLAFGPVMLGCLARIAPGSGPRAIATGVLIAQAYAVYSWLLWPVLARAIGRLVARRGSWAKTERVPLEDGDEVAAALAPGQPGPT